jgi:hypothetical protein
MSDLPAAHGRWLRTVTGAPGAAEQASLAA